MEESASLVSLSASENPYYVEACAQHIISKLLLDEEKELHQAYSKLLEDYGSAFSNVEESVGLLPAPMKQAMYSSPDADRWFPSCRREWRRCSTSSSTRLKSNLFPVFPLRSTSSDALRANLRPSTSCATCPLRPTSRPNGSISSPTTPYGACWKRSAFTRSSGASPRVSWTVSCR